MHIVTADRVVIHQGDNRERAKRAFLDRCRDDQSSEIVWAERDTLIQQRLKPSVMRTEDGHLPDDLDLDPDYDFDED